MHAMLLEDEGRDLEGAGMIWKPCDPLTQTCCHFLIVMGAPGTPRTYKL